MITFRFLFTSCFLLMGLLLILAAIFQSDELLAVAGLFAALTVMFGFLSIIQAINADQKIINAYEITAHTEVLSYQDGNIVELELGTRYFTVEAGGDVDEVSYAIYADAVKDLNTK